MNDNEPNDRLVKDGPPHVAALLKSAGLDEATDAELADLDQRMGAQLAAPPAPGRFAAPWLGGGIAVVVIAAASWWALSSAPVPPAAEPQPLPPVAMAPVAPEPELAPPPAPVEAEVAPPAPPPEKKPAAKKDAVAPPATEGPPAAPTPDPADELVLLERAQTALRSGDFTGALDRVAEHERDFPEGLLAQEREVLAVEALLKQGQREQAEQRAAQFLERYAGSVHRTKVRALLRDAGS